ncbi:MAG TPA: hypothetical protein VHQ92_10920 [Pseudolabrys sp.]|nr:hypothetical protein [Pseudolabrys sp.]
MRALLLPIVLGALVAPAHARSLEVIGYSGYLGEWELSATVTEMAPGRNGYSGPLTMKHVGICTQDGPEQKTGEMHLQISASSSRLDATLLVAGVECTYSGRLSDSYTGTMTCPDREAVPLKLWVK